MFSWTLVFSRQRPPLIALLRGESDILLTDGAPAGTSLSSSGCVFFFKKTGEKQKKKKVHNDTADPSGHAHEPPFSRLQTTRCGRTTPRHRLMMHRSRFSRRCRRWIDFRYLEWRRRAAGFTPTRQTEVQRTGRSAASLRRHPPGGGSREVKKTSR